MPRKRRKQPPQNGSLAKNLLLFCVSLTILVGASLLFNDIIHWQDLPLKDAWGNMKSSSLIPAKSTYDNPLLKENSSENAGLEDSKHKTSKSTKHSENVSTDEYQYLFYDILTQQKQNNQLHNTPQSYAVQIAAFKDSERAQAYKDSLYKKKRLTCRVMKRRKMNIIIWGNFSTKNAALRYNRKLSRVLGQNCVVVEL